MIHATKTQRITFRGHDGSTLAARLDLPAGEVTATALFAHCFTCSKDIPAAKRISQRLAQRGLAVLRFDFTGLGHSEGEFANTNFSTNVADLVLAAQALADRHSAPQLLIGHSLGGAAVLRAAAQIPSARAVTTIGAPFDPGHVAHLFGEQLADIQSNGCAPVDLAGRPFAINKQFLDDIAAQEMGPAIASLHKALLVLHAPTDDTVGIENAADIFMAAKHPKSFVTLDDADHLITRIKDAVYVADTLQAWASRYVDLRKEQATAAAPDGAVHVAEADPNGFLQDVDIAGRHSYLADEPAAVGGTDLGPTPYQYLSAGLGACTTMTIRMYARHKGYALTHVAVDVYHDKRHIDDMEGQTKQDVFRRDITLEGRLSEEERADLLRVADKCPVHKTLHSEAKIETRLLS